MNFNIICSGCGASSGPSVGICPFCKTVMTSKKSKTSAQESTIQAHYAKGRLDLALALANKMYSNPASKEDVGFLLLFAKILIDTEAPTSHIKSILAEAHLAAPDNTEVLEYIDLMDAKGFLKKGIDDPGELMLQSLLRRSPNNIHALFLMGTHLFWEEESPALALPYLETCVRLSPTFLRAWGCLGVIYQKIKNPQLASRAFAKCAELEMDPTLKAYFLQQAAIS